ncbi:hypothetical protein TcasGA2_TC033003 [Tribolium castaneum]|uniref:Uncharacterized protein n=1 Tax=Tribolium castaneum TaxID=7070 RepID=A0A139WI02_TRICA|nr:PREDICTED: uncharacterized protein LOC107397924 [Tribolium castaneum]XP_015835454.1 PREDICTED: uncharacterized protein LOC107397924 [Tribolium castaneum]KYB27524.1 hypothetical protein TcasGA2_TC033003 [Tribolium castaneum]|eukprot:XP_015835453.1 PREDICTED: uncharacterized protein LOC107397924 [Tribolium castaneum]
MILVLIKLCFVFICFSSAEKNVTKSSAEIESEKDQEILKESIQLYGSPRSMSTLDLPGPRLTRSNLNDVSTEVKFNNSGTGNYSFEFYAKTKKFAYLERYEVGEIKKIGNETIQTVRGQFAERIDGGKELFYIRTIGYTADQNGYQPFLLDLSKVKTTYMLVYAIAHLVGIPMGPKIAISSTVIATLTGGNLG